LTERSVGYPSFEGEPRTYWERDVCGSVSHELLADKETEDIPRLTPRCFRYFNQSSECGGLVGVALTAWVEIVESLSSRLKRCMDPCRSPLIPFRNFLITGGEIFCLATGQA
jgi:hypothetical protein